MANEVKILISAVDKASATLNKIQSELTQTGQAGKTGFMGMASGALAAVGGVAAVGAAVYKGAQFVQGAVNDWAAYNEEIRKLSIATSAAPEDISRMMQAADDLGVSMDSLQVSLKMVAKNGVQPTIENIAKLSDQLLAIEDPTKRAEEAARLFGRQWVEIAPFVLAGSEAIMDGTAAIADNMVATQESINASREYMVALDNLTDSWTGLKNTIGNEAMPVIADAANGLNDLATAALSTDNVLTNLFSAIASGNVSIEVATGIIGAYVSGMIDGKTASDAFRIAAGQTAQVLPDMAERLRGVTTAQEELGTETEQTAIAIASSNDMFGYASQAIGEYITNADMAQEAMDALGLATGELTLTEIELRDGVLQVTQALQDGLITPKQWADMMVILGDETIIAADKVAILRGYINSLKDKTVTITVNMVKTGNYAAGATGVEIEGVTGNAGGGGARLPANPATNKVTGGKGQSGLDMVVPPGYPNDQFPIFASSGERAIIVPENARYITGGYNGIGGGVIIQNFNIYQQPGQSAMALAEIIAYQASRQSTASAAGIKYAGR